MKTRIWPILLASGVGLAILMGLGIWQVNRLVWKEALIAQIDAQLTKPAISLDAALTSAGVENFKSMKVETEGFFLDHRALRLLMPVNGGPGWELIQGFQTTSGQIILVDRGGMPDGQNLLPQSGKAILTGILRQHEGRGGIFDSPADAALNIWTWWDVTGMYLEFGQLGMPTQGLVLHLLPHSPGTEGLFVDTPKANLSNNHLGYAITWFGLAAVLVVMTGLFVYVQIKNDRHSRRARNEVE